MQETDVKIKINKKYYLKQSRRSPWPVKVWRSAGAPHPQWCLALDVEEGHPLIAMSFKLPTAIVQYRRPVPGEFRFSKTWTL